MADLVRDYDPRSVGEWMFSLMEALFPLPRSITGDGFRETQRVLAKHVDGLQLEEVPSGAQAFDWTVPKEWNITAARLTDPSGRVVADLADHPLHVLNYSTPIDATLSLDELRPHLHTEPGQPDAIPYRTSYYEEQWGFCLSETVAASLPEGRYHALIDATLSDGVLNYGEWLLPGERDEEVVVSAHACHPAMCNDNLSGVVVAAALARHFVGLEPRRTHRILFIPGGIGSVVWMWRNQERLDRVVAGITLGCLGDEAPLTYKETWRGDSLVDRAATIALRDGGVAHRRRPFEPYGFDERNFNSPRYRLPVGSLTRSPHSGFPGYHTSSDDLSTMDAGRLGEALGALLGILQVVESDRAFRNLVPEVEPQLGKRGLYDSIGGVKERKSLEMAMLWVMNLSDGFHSLVDVADRSGLPFQVVSDAAELLVGAGLVEES